MDLEELDQLYAKSFRLSLNYIKKYYYIIELKVFVLKFIENGLNSEKIIKIGKDYKYYH